MKKTYLLGVLWTMLAIQFSSAQQDANFSLYQFNQQVINPAAVGSYDDALLSFIHRSQFQGVEHAPSTQLFSFAIPINDKVGLGLSVVNDKVFVLKQTDFAIDFSYKLQITSQHNLYFGIKAGGGNINIDLTRAGAPGDDPLFAENQSFFNPHIGAGLYLQHQDYYISVSTPNVLNGERYVKEGNQPVTASDVMHLYMGGGFHFRPNPRLEITPAVMFRQVAGAPLATDISTSIALDNTLTTGANYRLDETVSVFALMKVAQEKLNLGFSYDIAVNTLNNLANTNSIELIFQYKFK